MSCENIVAPVRPLCNRRWLLVDPYHLQLQFEPGPSFLAQGYPSGWSGSVAKQFLVGMEIYWTPGTNFFKIVILGVFIIWGDSFWNAYCGRIHPCEGIAFNLAASSSNPTREAGFQKEFKISCKIQNSKYRIHINVFVQKHWWLEFLW